jgi:hypothetical protein
MLRLIDFKSEIGLLKCGVKFQNKQLKIHLINLTYLNILIEYSISIFIIIINFIFLLLIYFFSFFIEKFKLSKYIFFILSLLDIIF